jgi:peptide/nickel transport system substrate-binding protein
MKMSWRIFVTAILIVSALSAGCTPTKTPAPTQVPVNTPATTLGNPTTAPGGATSSIPSKISRTIVLDPATASDADSLAVSALVYDSLTRLDASGAPQPALAASWKISEDQLDYILNLRQDASFQSGTPFDADAVLANFNRWFDPANTAHGTRSYAGWKEFFLGFKGELDSKGIAVSPFDGIEKADQHTVLIHLNRPMPNLLTILAKPNFAMIDPTLLASKVDAVGMSADSTGGTGQYTVSSWTDSGLVLTPNAKYWNGAPAAELQFTWK